MEHLVSDEQSLPPPGDDPSVTELSSPGGSGSIQQPDSTWCQSQDLQSPVAAISTTNPSQDEFPNQYPYSDASPMSVAWVTPNVTISTLPRREASYLHHFSTHLARWLDCTDASRQFTLNVTALAKSSPILLYAVISYAARHLGDGSTADQFQEKCIELLIPLLSTETIANQEAILCAIVILRVCEQLSGKSHRAVAFLI